MKIPDTGNELHRLNATLVKQDDGTTVIEFSQIAMAGKPSVEDRGLYATYPGATLTAKAFDRALPGLGKWLVTLVSWFFAISTMISWSYYGEQGIVFMFSQRSVPVYRYILCLLVVVATMGFIETPQDLDNFSALGNGFNAMGQHPHHPVSWATRPWLPTRNTSGDLNQAKCKEIPMRRLFFVRYLPVRTWNKLRINRKFAYKKIP